MYPIKFIDGFFEEIEIISFTDSFIEALGGVLNDEISRQVLLTMKQIEDLNLRELAKEDGMARMIVDRMDKIMNLHGDKIKRLTLHFEVAERGLFDLNSKLNIVTTVDSTSNKTQVKKDLDWLFENRQHWLLEIPVREGKAFKEFMGEALTVAMLANLNRQKLEREFPGVQFNYSENLEEKLKWNAVYFYSPHEKPRQTNMRSIAYNAQNLEVVRHGLEYAIICNKMNIRDSFKRTVVF